MGTPDAPHAAGILFRAADGRMLFLERAPTTRDHPGKWCWPGGAIDPGETPKVAARREAHEEVGHRPEQLANPIDRRGGFVTYLVNVNEPFEPLLNDEHTRAVWRRPDEAPAPLHPGVAMTLLTFEARGTRPPRVAMDARRTVTPIRPSAALEVDYAKRLTALIDEMASSVIYWLRAAYKQNTPATVEQLAQDSAASILQAAFDKLANRWLRKFDNLSGSMATRFASANRGRAERLLAQDLRKAGFTVRFTMTRAMRDAFDAVIDENIGLIKSVAERHLGSVRVLLNQAVQNGGDLADLTTGLEKQTGITRRRAVRIARDQTRKATAVMVRTRAIEAGITQAIWLHSTGGKEPRHDHVAFSGQMFDLRKGHDFENGEGVVWPGTAINCRCVMRPVVPGFE